uniref:Uncharacterized protein n=1 Tax=Anguilla anguilla TaxID=7936 RepID=A0A0E9S5M4_ANGAN
MEKLTCVTDGDLTSTCRLIRYLHHGVNGCYV